MIATDRPSPDPLAAVPSVPEWHAIDRATFETEIVPAHKPAILRGVVRHWPAVAAAATPDGLADYVAGFDNGRPADTFVGAPGIAGRFFYSDGLGGLNFARRQVPLRSTLAKLVEQRDAEQPIALYAGAVGAADYAPGFAAVNPMPLLQDDVPPRLWVGNATRIAPHYDLGNNIACVVGGRRRFLFFPPEQVENLYVGPLERTVAGQPISLVDPDAPDLDRYPRFEDALARAQVAWLDPGDAVYVPSLWWHGVRSFGPLNLLVNYWWGQSPDGSPFEAMMHALLTVRDLPAGERAAWRSFFDHYVFADRGDRHAHLPASALGVLAPGSPERSRTLRAFLRGVLER